MSDERPPEDARPDESDAGVERESTPLLLARLSSKTLALETERRARRSIRRPLPAPPLAGVDFQKPGVLTRRLGLAALLVAACLVMLSIFADLVASDLPIACRLHGVTYVLPNVVRPVNLVTMDREELEHDADWIVHPVVRHGPRIGPGETLPALRPPGAGHLLGTDRIGRDVLARTIHGTRSYLVFALAAVLASLGVGAFLGAIAGLFGGALDAFVSRVIESISAFPPLVLVLGVQAAVPQATLFTLFLAIALTRWPEIARLVRSEVMQATTRDYVLAARALGASPFRILRRHIVPNVRAPLVVAAGVGMSAVVLTEASLDFLRVGTPANAASWGETMSQFRDAPTAWWLLAFPGVLLVVTIIAYNLMGEALRSALDPR